MTIQRFNEVAIQGTFAMRTPMKMTFSHSSKFAYIDANSLLVVIVVDVIVIVIVVVPVIIIIIIIIMSR